jgi:hypothetical protein
MNVATTAKFLEFSAGWSRPVRDPEHDWYRYVPKDLYQNILFRERLIKACEENPELAEEVWCACKRDILFWINAFCFLKEPRDGTGTKFKTFPWITWPAQDWAFTEMQDSLGVENVIAPKSRAVGFTWMVLALFLHAFIFEAESEFGIASENEAKVDKKGKQNTLFAKLDFMLKYQPRFIIAPHDYERKTLLLRHTSNGSLITGYPSTADLNRGGRDRAFLNDELAAFPAGADHSAMNSLRAVTNSQFIVSTYGERDSCAFNTIAEDQKFPGKRIRMTWRDCPPQAAGLYTSHEGKLEIVDKSYPWPKDGEGNIVYPFELDGRYRSPYYDLKTGGLTPQARAREYDVDRKGAGSHALNRQKIEQLAKEQPLSPKFVGVFGFDPDDQTPRFEVQDNGHLSLWCELEDGLPPQQDWYAAGIDIAAGVGGSNSVISVFSRSSGEQVAEYVNNWIDPIKFCNLSVALCKFFRGNDEEGAFMVPECNGSVGKMFMGELDRIGYGNIYQRDVRDEITKRQTKKIGWHNSEGIGTILNELLRAAGFNEATIRSGMVFREMGEYVFRDGKIVHGGAIGSPDESESGDTHGDAAGAAAMAWLGCKAMPVYKSGEPEAGPPFGSIAWFREQEIASKRSKGIFAGGLQ